MLKSPLLLLICMVLLGCDTKLQKPTSSTPPNSVETTVSKDEFPIPIFTPTSFLEIDSLSNYVMYPLTWTLNSEEEKSISFLSKGVAPTYNNYWNILFYNKKTKKSHLLHSDTNLFITNIIVKNVKKEEYGNDNHHYTSKIQYNVVQKNISQPSYIFYLVVTDDYDKNQVLEEHTDPTYLYISDREGKNFRQLSPKNIQVREWRFISSNEILLYGLQDTNQDKDFDDVKFDRNVAFHITILPDSIKTDAIIADSLQEKLQKQFAEFYTKNLQPKESD